jgi:hypothetical protein
MHLKHNYVLHLFLGAFLGVLLDVFFTPKSTPDNKYNSHSLPGALLVTLSHLETHLVKK